MWLKNVGRVEAFLFLEYVALTVHALMERELRQAMQREGVQKLPRRSAGMGREIDVLTCGKKVGIDHRMFL